MTINRSLLEAALLGYGAQLSTINAKVTEIRQELGLEEQPPKIKDEFFEPAKSVKKKRKMSAAGRKAISRAQKARWRIHRGGKAA